MSDDTEDATHADLVALAPPDTRSIVIARLSGLEWDEISQILGLRQRILLDRWERFIDSRECCTNLLDGAD